MVSVICRDLGSGTSVEQKWNSVVCVACSLRAARLDVHVDQVDCACTKGIQRQIEVNNIIHVITINKRRVFHLQYNCNSDHQFGLQELLHTQRQRATKKAETSWVQENQFNRMKLFCTFSMCTKGELAGSMFISIKLVVFELYLSGGRFRLIAAFLLLPLTKEGYSTYRYSCNLEHQTT